MEQDLENADQRRPNKRPRVLVACQRCKSRRQKCDNASPVCSNCSRARVACMYSENAYPSSYVKRLEERVRQLEQSNSTNEQNPSSHSDRQRERLDKYPSVSGSLISPQSRPQTQPDEPAEERHAEPLARGLGLLSSCAAAEPHYFGVSAGLSLAHFVQVAIDSGSNSADVSLPLLADRPFSNKILNANSPLAELPSFKTGARYVRAYLSVVHPLYPFLDRASLWQLHGSLTRQQAHIHDSRSPIDIALIHLVYAIGSRCLQLLGKVDVSKNTPESHFLTAMQGISEDLKFTSIRSIEVTLLLAIHSMRSPAGTSVWHLSGLAIRQCLELGLHKQRIVDRQNLKLNQHRKRLFWSAYIFERKTALVLGRPFALSDEEIGLDLPMNVDDDENEERNLITALETEASSRPMERTSLSFHRFHVELYQIHTEIRLSLLLLKKPQTKVEIQRRMIMLFEQLEDWKMQVLTAFDVPSQSIPAGAPRSRDANRVREPGGSDSDSSGSDQDMHHRLAGVEKAELFLEYHKARRSLLQPLMTEGRDSFPFDTADYIACADASGQICQLYRRLHRLSPIPFSLRDLHAVFVAGFTLIYCICTCPSVYSAQRASDVGACSTVLYVITEQWSSAKKYRDAFEVVAEKMMESTGKYQESSAVGQFHNLNLPAAGNRAIAGTVRGGSLNNQPDKRANNANDRDDSGNVGLTDYRTNFTREARSQSFPYSTALLPETRNVAYDGESSMADTLNPGMELDLESYFYDIEGLLSDEGLDWFTGAVL